MTFLILHKIGIVLILLTRLHLASTECRSFDLSVTADDYMIMYVDGIPATGLQNAFDWNNVDTVRLTCATRVIAIQGINMRDIGGIRASDSSGYILTNTSWKCTNVAYPGWEKIDFDDSRWPAAVITDTGSERRNPAINTNSKWIWSSNWRLESTNNFNPNSNIHGYCRKKLAVNECALTPPHNLCTPSAGRCEDTPNGYRCICSSGYKNTKNEVCEDIDECSVLPPPNLCTQQAGQCVNLPGSYRCVCNSGYNNSGLQKCEDVDECKFGPPINLCNKQAGQCVNLPGSYRCDCYNGYNNSGLQTCSAAPGAEPLDGTINKPSVIATPWVVLGVSLLINLLLFILAAYFIHRSRVQRTGQNVSRHLESSFKPKQADSANDYLALHQDKSKDEHVYEEIHAKIKSAQSKFKA